MFKKIAAWFSRHPAIKTVVVTAVGAAGGAVIQGVSGGIADPRLLAKLAGAGALGAVYGLFVKRPQDRPCDQRPNLIDAAKYVPCSKPAGHDGPHNYYLDSTIR